MKELVIITGLLIVLVAAMLPDNDTRVFKQLYALEGTWLMKTQKGFIGEEWRKMDNDYLQNRGFIVRGNDTIISERVALRNQVDGIFYISTVEDQNNKQPVAFKLVSATNNIFVFENPGHDFPKRIGYHLVSKDSLYAWIDDGTTAPKKQSSFGYKKIK